MYSLFTARTSTMKKLNKVQNGLNSGITRGADCPGVTQTSGDTDTLM